MYERKDILNFGNNLKAYVVEEITFNDNQFLYLMFYDKDNVVFSNVCYIYRVVGDKLNRVTDCIELEKINELIMKKLNRNLKYDIKDIYKYVREELEKNNI